MGGVSTDVLISTAIQFGLNDLRANAWILPDVLDWIATDKMSSAEYGYKEIQAFIEFFQTNKFDVYLDNRWDGGPLMPCITISSLPRAEMENRDSLGDEGDEYDVAAPKNGVRRPIYVYEPFAPAAYNRTDGIVTFPAHINTSMIVPGQFFVSSKTGKAYQIIKTISGSSFSIKPGVSDDFTNAYVVPQVSAWNLKKELIYVQEHVVIGVHAQGNPVHNQWLHEIVWYILLRCKETFLEGRGFNLSTLSSEPIYLNPNFKESDKVYSRNITLQGQLEFNFIKYQAPKLQAVTGKILIVDGPKTPAAYQEEVESQAWAMAADAGTDAGSLGDDPEDPDEDI